MNIITKPFQPDFKYPQLFLLVLGALFFLPFLGSVHLFDWDEINFAESAREMMITGDYFRVRVNFEPFWEKPPLFFWLQVVCMKVIGVNEFAARLPNALCGIVSLLVFYRIGNKLYDHRFGMIWALLYFGALLPHMYFKSGIIDPVFNLFIFLGVYHLLQVVEGSESEARKHSIIGGLFTGLAVLTKGPVGLLLVLLTFLVYRVSKKFKIVTSIWNVLIFAGMVFLVSCAWFGFETIRNGPWFLVEFIQYQIELFSKPVAGHKQPIYYHFVVVLIGCFPMSVLGIRKLWRNKGEDEVKLNFARWMRFLFWVVMILFTIVTTKIVHYSSMAYFPLSFLAAFQIHEWFEKGEKPARWQLIFNLVVGTVLGVMIGAIPFLMHFKEMLLPLVKDKFGQASLTVEVPMMGWEWLIGIIFSCAVLLSFFSYMRGKLLAGLTISSLALGLSLVWYSGLVLPKIERYTQGPAIDFYEQMQGQDVYIHTYQFKSYADYFYARKSPVRKEALNGEWLLTGPVDKPVYFITRINKKEKIEAYEELEFVEQRGGFLIYKREIPATKSRISSDQSPKVLVRYNDEIDEIINGLDSYKTFYVEYVSQGDFNNRELTDQFYKRHDEEYIPLLNELVDVFCETASLEILNSFIEVLTATDGSAAEEPADALASMYVCKSETVLKTLSDHSRSEWLRMLLEFGLSNIEFTLDSAIHNIEELKIKIYRI